MSVLAGVHPVREALRAGRPLDRVLIAKGAGGPKLQQIVDLCRQKAVALRFEPRDALDRISHSAVHQGVVAIGSPQGYASLEDVLGSAQCLVLLDGVEDPHNLGAILRTAHAAGADAALIPERRAAGLSEAVAKAAAGAIEHLPLVRIGNVRQTMDRLKDRNFWIYGLDERGERDYDRTDYAAPAVFVLGGEGKGLHEHVRKQCDVVVRIPVAGAIGSLNVSVAAGVVLFEWRRRQRLPRERTLRS
ncbi:MAG: 23S rRNA (guanosine(2251)-2'-O)-methyltransferase RlmB [Acidobacteria bacterium]|nr:23S rRNA (guanosine(2251)-2'-O)-methyltransferase RlmB [Acidobacteriota bacterium]